MVRRMASTIEIFYSYAHEDEKLRNKLEQQLALLQLHGQITNWHDRKINPGREWANEIDANLNKAQIILLLVSPAFLSSDYCYGVEMKRALERHESGEARVIPIILRPVHWEDAPFGKLQALPTDGKPVTSRSWHNLDEAFFDIAQGIRKAVKELMPSSNDVTPRMIVEKNVNVAEISKYIGDTREEEPLFERSRLSNPYYDYTAVRDLSMLFGREYELRVLFNAIDKRQCLSIVGTRRIGKSSVLKHLGAKEVQHRYGYNLDDRIFILLDAGDYLQKTREDFFRSVCEQIISQCWQFHLTLPSRKSGEDQFKELLEDIHRKGFRPVLSMDEFDDFALNPHFDPGFFSFLRVLAGVYDLVCFITASIRPLYEVTHTETIASSPFFNIFQSLTLGPLLPDAARQIITVPSSRAGHHFTPEEVEWVLAQAGRHPFFIQILCRLIFEEKVWHRSTSLDLEYIRDRAYTELLPYFDDIWKDTVHKGPCLIY